MSTRMPVIFDTKAAASIAGSPDWPVRLATKLHFQQEKTTFQTSQLLFDRRSGLWFQEIMMKLPFASLSCHAVWHLIWPHLVHHSQAAVAMWEAPPARLTSKIKTIKKYIKSPGCFQTNISTIINTFCLYLTILCSNTALALGSFSTPTSTSESWAVTVGRKSWKDSFSRNRKVGNDGNKLDCLGLTLFMASHDSITNFTNIFGNFLFAVSAGWRVAGAFKNHSSHRKLHWNPLSAWSNSFCGSHKNFKADRWHRFPTLASLRTLFMNRLVNSKRLRRDDGIGSYQKRKRLRLSN